MKKKVEAWDTQTIKMTSGAACEAVGAVLRKTDWSGSCCAEITYKILEALGFKGMDV